MTAENNPHLLWHETSSGCYERDVDEAELFYTTLARLYEGTGRTFFAITGHLELTLELSHQANVLQAEQRLETALRKAWRRLRYDHPTLASAVEYNNAEKKCKKVYQTLQKGSSGSSEAEWLEASFRKLDNRQSGVEFCNADPPVEKYPTLFLITPPARAEAGQNVLRRDLVFRSHHDIIDGIGTLTLLNNLLRHAAEAYSLQNEYPEVKFGDESKNLSPSFRIAAGLPPSPSQAQKDRLQAILATNAAGTENVEVVGIPFKNKTAPPGMNQRAAIFLTEAETGRILAGCKKLGASVTQAFHAGIVLAVRDLQERKVEARNARYINYSLINLRSRCAPPYNTELHPAAVYHSASGRNLVIDVTIPAESSPPESTSQLKAEYSSVLSLVRAFYLSVQSDPEHVGMVPLYFASRIPAYPEKVPEVPAPNQAPSVSISSMGVVDKIIQPQHGPFRVENPWVTGDEFGTGIGVFLGSWKGSMCISAGYNEAYHDREAVVGFLETLKVLVTRALE